MTRMRATTFIVLSAWLSFSSALHAQSASVPSYIGRTIASVIDTFTAQGWNFAYSSNLVSNDLLVTVEPVSDEPLDIVREILRPHRLAVREQDEYYLVVRMSSAEVSTSLQSPQRADGQSIDGPSIDNITVSASRYSLSRDNSSSRYYMDQRSIQNTPDVGEDPIRSVQRLPGAAAGGYSAKTHLRGGDENEMSIVLNGHRLLDPFHIRDYQSIFSSIDYRAINGIEVYTGGFPVRYGDHLSGLVLIDALNPEEPRRTEIGLSVFNTSLLSGGTAMSGDLQWLTSVRRGNLDLVIDEKFGEPTYYDLFGQVSVNLAPGMQLSFNGLYSSDQVLVVLEDEPEELEQADSDTRNAQFWVRLDNQWSDALSSVSLFSISRFDNDRLASTLDEDKYISNVDDRREISRFGFRQDWNWILNERHRVQWGLQYEYGNAVYDYQSEVTYGGLSELLAGTDETQYRDLAAAPDGDSYSLYLSDRWRVFQRTFLELGLRWDRQTYTTPQADSQLSPRIGVLHALGQKTELRVSWGRYHQSQGIDELQIEDGVTAFRPAQQADHFIVGLGHRFGNGYAVRIEAFHKEMDRLRPRFENLFDPFALIPELAADRVELAPRQAVADGIEISLDYASEGPFGWWATYSLSRAEDKIDGVDELRSWDQRHALLAGVTWSTERWEAAVTASIHSGWPRTALSVTDGVDEDDEPILVPVVGPRNAEHYPTFATLDARISRKFDVRRGTLTAFFEIANATNRRNVCCSDYDLEEDENGVEFLEFSEDYWLPMMPAIGILWEF